MYKKAPDVLSLDGNRNIQRRHNLIQAYFPFLTGCRLLELQVPTLNMKASSLLSLLGLASLSIAGIVPRDEDSSMLESESDRSPA